MAIELEGTVVDHIWSDDAYAAERTETGQTLRTAGLPGATPDSWIQRLRSNQHALGRLSLVFTCHCLFFPDKEARAHD